MGLDILPLKPVYDESVGFSYGGFHSFRKRLAAAVGIDLLEMEGFGGEQRPWPDADDEPLVYLLHHSDCDGSLGFTECDAIAYRLREVTEKAFADSIEDGWMRERGFALADLCERVSKGEYERLEFS